MYKLSPEERVLAGINVLLKSDYKSFEELQNGAVWCYLLERIFPNSINLKLIKQESNNPIDWHANYHLLHESLKKLHIAMDLRVHDIIDGDPSQMMQLFYMFIDLHIGRESLNVDLMDSSKAKAIPSNQLAESCFHFVAKLKKKISKPKPKLNRDRNMDLDKEQMKRFWPLCYWSSRNQLKYQLPIHRLRNFFKCITHCQDKKLRLRNLKDRDQDQHQRQHRKLRSRTVGHVDGLQAKTQLQLLQYIQNQQKQHHSMNCLQEQQVLNNKKLKDDQLLQYKLIQECIELERAELFMELLWLRSRERRKMRHAHYRLQRQQMTTLSYRTDKNCYSH